MALFKIEKGLAANLAVNRPNTTEGWCYFTSDDGKFYIDTATATGTAKRVVLNAEKADKLKAPRTINGTSFDGSQNITTANWGNPINIKITDGTNNGSAVSINGSTNVLLDLPNTIKATLEGNATSANKLAIARTISLSTGATGTATSFDGSANISIPVTGVKETYLNWGGKNIVGNVSPLGCALSAEHSSNRLAYLNPNAITIEYSNDGGTTYTDSGLGAAEKKNLVTKNASIKIGSSATTTLNDRTRITITATKNDGKQYFYCAPKKMLLQVYMPRHKMSVTIETKTGVNGATWIARGTYPLSGWSGWNEIPLNFGVLGGSPDQTGQPWQIRLTFAITSVNSSTVNFKNCIYSIRLFADNAWMTPSNLAKTGHIYSYDTDQNTTFPAKVTATSFIGNATSADKLEIARNITLTGAVTGSGSFDGSGDLSITTAIGDADYLPLSGGTVTGTLVLSSPHISAMYDPPLIVKSDAEELSFFDNTIQAQYNNGSSLRADELSLNPAGGNIYLGEGSVYYNSAANVLFGAAWNDYAEFRELKGSEEIPHGRVVVENGDDTLSLSTKRLQPGGNICSDTFGFAIGETDKAKMPIAVSGRVLVYPAEDRNLYKPGDAVCTGPNGTVSKMTRGEIKEYPDRIIGYVSAVPNYEIWGENNVAIDGRIWVKVK